MHGVIGVELSALWEMSGIHLEKEKDVIPDAHFALCIGQSQEQSFVRPEPWMGRAKERNPSRGDRAVFSVKILASEHSNCMSPADIESAGQVHEPSS